MAKRDMLIPKPSRRRRAPFIPSIGIVALNWHAQALTQAERQALHEICEGGDVFHANGQTWLLAPLRAPVVDILAAFEAEWEDLELLMEDDEPDPDGEDNQ